MQLHSSALRNARATIVCAAIAVSCTTLVACQTTNQTTRQTGVKLAPLPESAAVAVFDREPNVKFDLVCEIEVTNHLSTTSQTQLLAELKVEARKCGGDGIIVYNRMLSTVAGESTKATAIKIRSREAGFVTPETVTAFSLAIQRHDLTKVRELLANVPKAQKDRAPSDDLLVNLGLYVATLDGLRCSAKIVALLEVDYEAKITSFAAVKMPSPLRDDAETPLCLDVIARSLPKMENPAAAVLTVNNYYVNLLATYDGPDLDRRVSAYNAVLREAARLIVDACASSNEEPTCKLKTSFQDFAEKTGTIKSKALKRNAKDILKIFSAHKKSATQSSYSPKDRP